MQVKLKLYSILFFFTGWLFCSLPAYAQKIRENVPAKDSTAWHKHIIDSTRDARQIEIELAKKVRQKSLDSAKDARQQEIELAKEKRKSSLDAAKDIRQHIMDSTHLARQHIMDSSKQARQQAMDSMKLVRKQKLDSMQRVRKLATASLNAQRKYKESKHYRDSVTRAHNAKANEIKAKRKAYTDSLTASRKKMIDSMTNARKLVIAAMHEKLKKRTDSLDKIRKYKESKRYRDSVTVFKKARMETLAKARKHFTDSVMGVRKHFVDSMATARKRTIDSMAKLRNKRLDSLKDARKKRADSLQIAKTKKDNQLKANQKKDEQKKQLALELKIKKQHEAWSNEKMLKKKWSLKRKVVQNTFARYNYYYNANRKMDEALANMQRVKKENYDSLIELYPFNPNRDSTVLASDMDSILHKISVGIQIHDPRTKWEDDMYLLMGQAQYYKGRYNDAATAFHYIISMDEQRKKKPVKGDKTEPSIVEKNKKTLLDFMKHKPVHNEAILWLSRTYTQASEPEKSESVLALLDADSNLPKSLNGRVALERAFLALNENNSKEASKQLSIATDDKNLPDWLRQRSAFISGQLLQRMGEYIASAASFEKVLDLNPKIDMDFYARKYMAFNTMYAGKDPSGAEVALKKVLDDNKYAAYYEQVYFVLGIMSAQLSDNEAAITYLQKGLHTPKTTKKQKAISFAALGNVYYNTGNYMAAKHAYDSSARFVSYAPNDSFVIAAINRSKVLDDVTGPAGIVHEQDSLLALALLSNKEQRSIVRKYIRHLEDLRRDSIYKAENAGINSIALAEPTEEAASAVWYFSSSTMMQQGLNEFKRKWGNRPNADNWRRMSALSFASSGNNGTYNNSGTNLEGNGAEETGLPSEDELLAAIPNSPEQQSKAYKLIQTAYVDLGDAYVNKLQDYPQAVKTLDTLDKRFPSNDQQAKVLYLRYIIALRNHDFDKAKLYSSQLLSDYPNSDYAKKVKPAEDGSNLLNPTGVTVAVFYEETYKQLMDHQYSDVIIRAKQAEALYKDPKYKLRFQLINAMALAATSDFNKADTVLIEFFKSNPPDSLRIIGETVKNYISRNRPAPPAPTTKPTTNNVADMNKSLTTGNPVTPNPLPGGGNNNKTDTTNKSNPNAGPNAQDNKPGYHYTPNAQHYCVIAMPSLDSRSLGIKAAVGDFNTFKYSSANLIANMDMLSPKQSLLVIKAFNNADDARSYMLAMKATPAIFHDYKPEEYQVFIISANNYIQLFIDRSTAPYMGFYKVNYKQ